VKTEPTTFGPIPGLEIREPLGRGGMGAVYKAHQTTLDRLVAVKTIHPELLTPQGMAMFQREARLLAKCRHPGVVQILEFHPEPPIPYFLMEYVDGVPLDVALRNRSWKERAAAFEKVTAAVAAAHDLGVVHGDLKPSNILMDRDSQPHILDFGVARLNSSDPTPGASDTPLGGTPAFMAPEVLEGATAPSPTSDVYALGVTLFAVLTGAMPYERRGDVLAGNAPLLQDLNPDVPEPLQRIVLKSLERFPEDRYPSAAQLRHDLERFCAGRPIYARPTRYQRELEGRIRNHVTSIELWEREGFLNQSERDALVQPYRQIMGQDSPWLSEMRRVLTGPLLIRVGAWLLLLSALLGPIFYWPDLGLAARVAGAAVPATGMGILALYWLVRRKRRNGLASVGSFLLTCLVLLAVLFAEYRWFQYLQPPEWELWGSLVTTLDESDEPAAARPRTVPGMQDFDPEQLEPLPGGVPGPQDDPLGGMQRQRPKLDRVAAYFSQRRNFILSNSQIAICAFTMALSIVLFFGMLRATFLACWLTLACVAVFSAGLLLVGVKEQLSHDHVALVSFHYLLFAVALFLLGAGLERAAVGRVARPFYAWAIVLFALSALAVAVFGVHEWLNEPWDFYNERLNLWLLAYSVPSLVLAWLGERFGTENQRRWTRLFYLLVPVFLLWPLNILFSARGPVLGTLGRAPFHLYELLYFMASIVLLVMGRWRHMSLFLWAGLCGLAMFVFRITFRHMRDELIWPTCIAAVGFILVALGIWRARRADPERPARAKRLAMTATASIYAVETVALPKS
jgi:hypothetical protein